jgi:hypothetical protein
MGLEPLPCPHRTGVCGPPRIVFAVAVVEIRRPVDRQAHEKLMLTQESAPLVRQQDSVGLQCVVYGLPPFVLPLECNHSPEEIQSHERRFAPLPCEVDLRRVLLGDILPYIVFEHGIGHPEIPVRAFLRIQSFLFQIKAVRTLQVADRADRLG